MTEKDLFGNEMPTLGDELQHVDTITETELLNKVIGDDTPPTFDLGGDYVGSNQSAETPPPTPEVDVTLGNFIPAPLAVGVMDSVIPAIMVWVGRKYMNVSFKKTELQATAMERKLLEPAVQTYLDSISLKMSPLEQLMIAITGIYGGKMLTAEPTPLAAKPKKPAAAKEDAPIIGDESFNDMAVTTPKKSKGRPRKNEI